MASHEQPDSLELMFFALDHAVDSIGDGGGPLIPFVMIAAGGRTDLHRFVAETLEESQERAREFLRSAGPEVDAAALAYDGYLTVGGVRNDAVFVVVQVAGADHADAFAQQYDAADGAFAEIGNVKHVSNDDPPLFAATPGEPARPATERRGIFSRRRRTR